MFVSVHIRVSPKKQTPRIYNSPAAVHVCGEIDLCVVDVLWGRHAETLINPWACFQSQMSAGSDWSMSHSVMGLRIDSPEPLFSSSSLCFHDFSQHVWIWTCKKVCVSIWDGIKDAAGADSPNKDLLGREFSESDTRIFIHRRSLGCFKIVMIEFFCLNVLWFSTQVKYVYMNE